MVMEVQPAFDVAYAALGHPSWLSFPASTALTKDSMSLVVASGVVCCEAAMNEDLSESENLCNFPTEDETFTNLPPLRI